MLISIIMWMDEWKDEYLCSQVFLFYYFYIIVLYIHVFVLSEHSIWDCNMIVVFIFNVIINCLLLSDAC